MTRGAKVTQPANEWLRFLLEVRELLKAIRAADFEAAQDGPPPQVLMPAKEWREVLDRATTLEDFMR